MNNFLKNVITINAILKILDITSLRFVYIFNKFGFRIVFSTQTCFCPLCKSVSAQNRSKWTKMDRSGPNRLNWTKVDGRERIRPNGNKVDRMD